MHEITFSQSEHSTASAVRIRMMMMADCAPIGRVFSVDVVAQCMQ